MGEPGEAARGAKGEPGAQIRAALPGDAAALLALDRAVRAEGAWMIADPDEITESLEARADRLRAEAPGRVWLVAEIGPRIVGALLITPHRLRRHREVGSLEILLAADARGQGLGGRLLSAGLAAARAAGLRKVSLAVLAENERAIRLYRAAGFCEEGRRVAEFRAPDGRLVDDLLMALSFAPLSQ